MIKYNKEFLFLSEEKFYDFVSANPHLQYSLFIGNVDNLEPAISSMQIEADEMPFYFDLDKIKPLLEYRTAILGAQKYYLSHFFRNEVYDKYGTRVKHEIKAVRKSARK